jgi:hypothetical protein
MILAVGHRVLLPNVCLTVSVRRARAGVNFHAGRVVSPLERRGQTG